MAVPLSEDLLIFVPDSCFQNTDLFPEVQGMINLAQQGGLNQI